MSGKVSNPVKKKVCAGDAPVFVSTWNDIISTYQRDHSYFPQAERKHFSDLSLQVAIERAALCRTPDSKRHPHQYRLRQETLNEFHAVLKAKAGEIDACSSFHELFVLVKQSRIPGIGELTIYDTAHRIGIHKGLFPEKVYLHAGTRRGASALGIDCKGREALEMHELPVELQQIDSAAVEDILCLFKDKFSAIQR